jgi:hypothetical protein
MCPDHLAYESFLYHKRFHQEDFDDVMEIRNEIYAALPVDSKIVCGWMEPAKQHGDAAQRVLGCVTKV